MSSPLNSLAICAYAFVREQCDVVAALFDLIPLGRLIPSRRSWEMYGRWTLDARTAGDRARRP